MTLSIITINYNNREGLQKTIDSVLAQTWKDFEWIVIDGGSTDGSRELIERFQEHFAYWCSEPDKGVYNAMNKGIAKAKGEYLNFMNSGDTFYEAETLQKAFSEERTADILYGDYLQVSDAHSKLINYPNPIDFYSFYNCMICHQALMIKACWLKEQGYDESMKICSDWKHLLWMALKGATFEHVGVPVCRYDMGGISSTQDELYQREKEQVRLTIPETVRLSMDLCYVGSRHTVRAKLLLDKGGIVAIITKVVLAILDKLFIRMDFTKYPYCD